MAQGNEDDETESGNHHGFMADLPLALRLYFFTGCGQRFRKTGLSASRELRFNQSRCQEHLCCHAGQEGADENWRSRGGWRRMEGGLSAIAKVIERGLQDGGIWSRLLSTSPISDPCFRMSQGIQAPDTRS